MRFINMNIMRLCPQGHKNILEWVVNWIPAVTDEQWYPINRLCVDGDNYSNMIMQRQGDVIKIHMRNENGEPGRNLFYRRLTMQDEVNTVQMRNDTRLRDTSLEAETIQTGNLYRTEDGQTLTLSELLYKFGRELCDFQIDEQLELSQEVRRNILEREKRTLEGRIERETDENRRQVLVNIRERDMETLENFEENIDVMDNKYVLIKGHVQSGKTSFMVSKAIQAYAKNISSIIVVRSFHGDKLNLINRINNYKKGIQEKLRRCRVPEYICKNILEVVYDNKVKECKLKDSMLKGIPKIYITISTSQSMEKISKYLSSMDRETLPYYLFIDEVDLIDNTTSKNKDAKKLEPLSVMKRYSKIMYGISATILDTTLKEDIDRKNVYMMPTPENYMSVLMFEKCELDHDAKPSNRTEDNPFEKDPNLREFLKTFCLGEGVYAEQPNPRNNKNYSHSYGCSIPYSVLLNIGKSTKPQEKIGQYVYDTYKNTGVGVVLYNGEGIRVWHKSMGSNSITIQYNGKMYISKYCRGTRSHIWKDIGVGVIYQWMKENGGVNKFPKIVTIAGHLAGRSISYVNSKYHEGKGWRLTDVYTIFAKDTPHSEILQMIGRGCGIIRDGLGVRVYGTHTMLNEIIKGYITYEELLDRSKRVNSMIENMGDIIRSLPISSCKIPKRKLTRVEKFKPNKVVDDSVFGGWDIEGEMWENVFQNNDTEYPQDEYNRLVNNMFPKWKREQNTVIGRFMCNLDPTHRYTKQEVQELGINDPSLLNRHSCIRGYGLIMKRYPNNTYQLQEILVRSYNNIFLNI